MARIRNRVVNRHVLLLLALSLLCIVQHAIAGTPQKTSFKQDFRLIMSGISHALDNLKPTSMEGLLIIKSQGCCGIRLDPDKFYVEPDIWRENEGLKDRYNKLSHKQSSLVASINGAFFCPQGILAPVVRNALLPQGVRQFPGSYSRCFVGIFQNKSSKKRWVLGETRAKGKGLLNRSFYQLSWMNRPLRNEEHLLHLLGGGGWIVRNGIDVHMEAYKKQRFHFKKEDQDSRHTVVAMDDSNRLYLLIFETGASLKNVSKRLRGPEFPGLTDAIFLDGGSSSTMVVQGAYLVAPLYLIDRARFSSLTVHSVKPLSPRKD